MTAREDRICPFCKSDNHCQVENINACWCASVEIPPAMIDLLPETQVGRSCICATCVQYYYKDPHEFRQWYRVAQS